jgi:FkbM family methyltransferase
MPEIRIGFIDVGARGGTSASLEPLHDRLHRVLVEPEATEAARLQAAAPAAGHYTVVPVALGHFDGEMDLHVTVNPTCTSALRVNHSFIDRYAISEHFRFKETVRVPCARYDTLYAKGRLPLPHAVKLDVQGFEYEVLLGFGELLQHCLAVELESHFYPLYEAQRTFGDLVRLLEAHDFMLRHLGNPRSPQLKGDYHFGGDLVEVDACFTKSRHWLRSRPEARPDFDLACRVFGVAHY